MLLSGGIDSATCAFLARKSYATSGVTFSYYGIAKRELECARAVGRASGLHEHRFVRLPDLKEAQDIGIRFAGLPGTYIPMRNAVFYSLAASFAEEAGAEIILGGHNKDDLGVFRDVSPGFFEGLQTTLRAGSKLLQERRLRILRPLRSRTKVQVVKLAASLGVPLEDTWSCHEDGDSHCWECRGCDSRRRAFTEAGVEDPLAKV